MSNTDRYTKHQTSKYKRFVGTMRDGKRFEADTEDELKEKIAKRRKELGEEIKTTLKEIKSNNSQKYDPNTGEPI